MVEKIDIIQWSIIAQCFRNLHEMMQCFLQFRSKHNCHIVIIYGGKFKLCLSYGLRWHEIRFINISKNTYKYTFISWGLLCLHSQQSRLDMRISSAGLLLLMNYLGTRQLLTLEISTLPRIMIYRALLPSMHAYE